MNSLCSYSDKFQEYKQKHLELKAAVARELGFKVVNGVVTPLDEGEKSSDQETGSGKEADDGGSSAVENAGESQQEQPAEETSVETAAVESANGHVVEPADDSQHEGSDRAASEVKIVNGESEVTATGEEDETSTANGDVKSESEEVNGEINGAVEVPASPSVLKSKGTWADVVSKAAVVNGTGDKDAAVNGVVDSITANGVAKEWKHIKQENSVVVKFFRVTAVR